MIALINHQGLKKITGLQLQSPSPPIGLAYLGAFLKQHGYGYLAVDACGEAMDGIRPYGAGKDVVIQGLTVEEVVDRIPEDTRIVGFTCLFSHCWPLVRSLVHRLRRKIPNAVFVAGGEHPTAMPGQTLMDGLDIVVRGEGEETFRELVTRIYHQQDWRDCRGLAYRAEDGEVVINPRRVRSSEIDHFPWPDWDSWHIEQYISRHQASGIHLGRSIPILGSRGCPYACRFCSSKGMWGRRYVVRHPTALVDEMEYFRGRYHIQNFVFMDSTFIINRQRALDFANEMIRRNLGVTYQVPAGTRYEAFDKTLVRALTQSGLKNLAFAPESGDRKILRAIHKQLDLDRFYKAVKLVAGSTMTLGCFIVIGFPEENRQSLLNTMKLIRKLALLGVDDVTVSKFTPYPGSAYFEQLCSQGKFTANLSELENVIDFFDSSGKSYCQSLTSQQLFAWMIRLYINFYMLSLILRPWRVVRSLWIYLTTNGIQSTRYMRLFHEFLKGRRQWKKGLSKNDADAAGYPPYSVVHGKCLGKPEER